MRTPLPMPEAQPSERLEVAVVRTLMNAGVVRVLPRLCSSREKFARVSHVIEELKPW